MKYFILYGLITFTWITVNAQRELDSLAKSDPPSKPYSKRILAMEEKNHACVRKTNKSFSQRLKNFPFNQSSQIKLVSFEENNLPLQNDSVCYSKLFEVKTLTFKQVDALTTTLYNVGFGGTILIIKESNCYQPRNAILFIDSSGKTFAYIEICFECEQTVTSSENILLGDMCNEKYSMIKQQFKLAGIRHGITNVVY